MSSEHSPYRLMSWPRVVVFLLGSIPAGLELHARSAPLGTWAVYWSVLLLWAPLPAIAAPRVADPKRMVKVGFAVDSLLLGCVAALLGFSAIPTACCSLVISMATGMFGPRGGGISAVLFATSAAATWAVARPEVDLATSSAAAIAGIVVILLQAAMLGYLGHINALLARRSARTLARLASEIGRYLPSQVYSAVFAGRSQPTVASERRFVTIVFVDLVGFTPMVEAERPNTVTQLLNAYLEAVVEAVEGQGGTVDKFIGDAVMCVFGAPSSYGVERDAEAAVAAALDIVDALALVEVDGGKTPLRPTVRIGIHSGSCMVGNFGTPTRMEYTAVGHPVNVASRIEGCAPPGAVLMSATTRDLVRDRFDGVAPMERTLKGVREPLVLYRPRPVESEAPTVPLDQPEA